MPVNARVARREQQHCQTVRKNIKKAHSHLVTSATDVIQPATKKHAAPPTAQHCRNKTALAERSGQKPLADPGVSRLQCSDLSSEPPR
ncbi:hypothetical protein NPIL_111001 [Nephila pilipes]|uniref:Uncharacterized protein n=1 Tax=Nephila pilipes TaxID=299642 RepID=A0A8X6NUD6_NEPPI|nr:hypothetical protein NPIL_111001 [Nephila pilipes]